MPFKFTSTRHSLRFHQKSFNSTCMDTMGRRKAHFQPRYQVSSNCKLSKPRQPRIRVRSSARLTVSLSMNRRHSPRPGMNPFIQSYARVRLHHKQMATSHLWIRCTNPGRKQSPSLRIPTRQEVSIRCVCKKRDSFPYTCITLYAAHCQRREPDID
jgi:hypothetical protein